MKVTKRKLLAWLACAVFLASMTPQAALADNYPTNLRIQRYINLWTDERMVGLTWNPVPLAAGIRIYRNGEQLTTLGGADTAYIDPETADPSGMVYRVGAIVDGTEYGSEIRLSDESRGIGTPAIYQLVCDRNSPYAAEFMVNIVCRPGEGANFYKLYGSNEEVPTFLAKQERMVHPELPAIPFWMVRERIPAGPTTYWYKVRAFENYNVPGTHMYILYEGPFSPVRALTFSPLELPDWRDLFDEPGRFGTQDWFDELAALFARRDAMENAELFNSSALDALLGAALGAEREGEAFQRLKGMIHPLGLALLVSGLVTPPDEKQSAEIALLLKDAEARYGSLTDKLPEGDAFEGFLALLSQLCDTMGILMLPDTSGGDTSISLYDSRMPVMGPVYSDRTGMASMLGTISPGLPNWSSGTAIDDDVTWSIKGPAGELNGFAQDKPPAWSIKNVAADKAGATIDDDVTWTIQCEGDTAGLSFCFVIFRDGMIVHQGQFSTANSFTYRVGKPGTWFAVGLVTDDQNGHAAQSADTIVSDVKPTVKPTAKPTKKPTEKPTDIPTEKPTDIPTEKPTDVPTEKPTETPTTNPNLVTLPPTAIPPIFTPKIPVIPIFPGPIKP